MLNLKLNGGEVTNFIFPGGEVHIRIKAQLLRDINFIEALIASSDDLMGLLLLVDSIRRIDPSAKINLRIPYFPYARQDRVCVEGEAFSLEVICNLINNLKLNKVIVVDVHSKKTLKLLNNCEEVSLLESLLSTLDEDLLLDSQYAIVAPDKGAKEKVLQIHTYLEKLGLKTPLYTGSKKRDLKSGRITSIEIEQEVKHNTFMIVDDICDGGGTFIGLADDLIAKGAKEVHLFITHGIFSKGFKELLQKFKTVSCYHSIKLSKNKLPENVIAQYDFKALEKHLD